MRTCAAAAIANAALTRSYSMTIAAVRPIHQSDYLSLVDAVETKRLFGYCPEQPARCGFCRHSVFNLRGRSNHPQDVLIYRFLAPGGQLS